MSVPRLRSAVLALAATMGLGACAYDDGYGYGYGGISAGYGSGYYDGYYDGWGYGYPGYYGWYGDFYYPGTGFYVYDHYGRRHRWNDNQRRYWEHRRENWDRNRGGDHGWRGHDGQTQPPPNAPQQQYAPQPRRDRGSWHQNWQGRRSGPRQGPQGQQSVPPPPPPH